MADDPIDEEFDEAEIDVDIEGDDLEGELVEDLEEVLADDVVLDDDEEDEAAADAALAARPKREDEDDEEEDLNPDDVEADLDAILKDRIAAADDDEDEDEEVVPEPRAPADIAEGVTPKKANEFMCTGCFLLVNRGQFGSPGAMHCPVGEAACPAIAHIESGALDRQVKAAAKKQAPKAPAKAPAKTPAKAAVKAPAKSAAKPPAKAAAKKAPAKKAPAKKAPAKKAKS